MQIVQEYTALGLTDDEARARRSDGDQTPSVVRRALGFVLLSLQGLSELVKRLNDALGKDIPASSPALAEPRSSKPAANDCGRLLSTFRASRPYQTSGPASAPTASNACNMPSPVAA